MAKKTLEQHNQDVKRWGPRGMQMLQEAMEKVLREVIAYAQKNRLSASAPRGLGSPILGVVSGDLRKRVASDSSVKIKGTEVIGRFGTNLTNRGFSYPRKHEYGLGVRERSWARTSVKEKQSRLREEVKRAWVAAYGK